MKPPMIPHNPEQDRHNRTARVFAGHNRFGDQACDQAEDDPTENR